MTSRRQAMLLSLALPIIVLSPAWAAKLPPALDPDKDGTMDMAEAKNAASALFDKLDKDHDGTLDAKELHRRIGHAKFAAADPDKDGTIDKNEYLKLVEDHFNAADPDHDGTLDASEMKSPAGRALMRLLA